MSHACHAPALLWPKPPQLRAIVRLLVWPRIDVNFSFSFDFSFGYGFGFCSLWLPQEASRSIICPHPPPFLRRKDAFCGLSHAAAAACRGSLLCLDFSFGFFCWLLTRPPLTASGQLSDVGFCWTSFALALPLSFLLLPFFFINCILLAFLANRPNWQLITAANL